MLLNLKKLFGKSPAPDLLHVFHAEGLESFPPLRSVFNYYTAEDGRRLFVIHLRCGKPLIQIEEFRTVFHPEPWLEVIFHRSGEEAELSAGEVLALPVGYDYKHNENITNFCYASHDSIEELKLMVKSWDGDRTRLQLSGLTGAAHGSKDTKISFDIEFSRDTDLRRSFN